MALVRGQLLVPGGLKLVKPLAKVGEPSWPKTKDSKASVLPGPLLSDHARFAEDPEMAAHGWCGHARLPGDLPRSHRTAAEELDDLPACRVRQGAQERVQFHRHG
jgi:hypothetical protein